MRRLSITFTAALMLLAFAPAGALARHHHRSHHRRAHMEHFGGDRSGTTSGSSSSDTAGIVQSFTAGRLTIMLNDADHTIVSGIVNGDTRIECMAAEGTQTMHEDGDRGGGDQSGNGGSGNDQAQGSDDQNGGQDQGDAAEQNNNQAEDQNDNDNAAANSCSSLAPRTVIREAELRISGGGSFWKKIEVQS